MRPWTIPLRLPDASPRYDPENEATVRREIQQAFASLPAALDDRYLALVFIPGLGMREIEVGAADSAGSGFRTLRVAN